MQPAPGTMMNNIDGSDSCNDDHNQNDVCPLCVHTLLLLVVGGTWWLLVVFGCGWLLVIVVGGCWWLLVVVLMFVI